MADVLESAGEDLAFAEYAMRIFYSRLFREQVAISQAFMIAEVRKPTFRELSRAMDLDKVDRTIRHLRSNKGMTYEEISKVVGISRQAVQARWKTRSNA